MDIEGDISSNQKTQTKQRNKKNVNTKSNSRKQQTVNKDLLRFQRPIYEIKKSEQSEQEYVIRKLMEKRQKPSIGFVGKSPILSKLQQMMPKFQQSNHQLLSRKVQQNQKIDVKLEECPESDSSSEDSSDEDDSCPIKISQTQKHNKKVMEIQHTHPDSMQEQQSQKFSENHIHGHNPISEPQQLELNFLRYPYLTQQQAQKLMEQKLNNQLSQSTLTQVKEKSQKPKKILIQQIQK